jgi:hypothetical protein
MSTVISTVISTVMNTVMSTVMSTAPYHPQTVSTKLYSDEYSAE